MIASEKPLEDPLNPAWAAEPIDDDEIVIEPGGATRHYWRDLWRYRELFYILSWRDVAVRYKQTVAGVAWAVVQPLLSMVIMSVIFGKVAGLPSEGQAPYPVMVFAAMLPWQFFSNALLAASQSVAANANLVSKVYFPRLIVPASPILVSLIDFAVSAGLLALLMAWFRFWPTWRVVTIPLFVMFAILAALGPALLFAALTVKYRDVRFVIPFVVQFGLYVSPVGFSSAVIPQEWRLLYSLNPVVGVIDGFRWCLLGGDVPFYWPGFLASLGVVLFFIWFGVRYFRATERSFADMV